MLFRRVNLKFFRKFRFESFPILITVICKRKVIELCNSKIGVKIKKSLYLKNINPSELKVVLSLKIVSRGLSCENF